MAKLTSKARSKLKSSQFAGPGKTYPVEDKTHAADAKSRASAAEHEGRMSKSAEKRIDAKANKVLRKKGKR
jgi:hypothetical protein